MSFWVYMLRCADGSFYVGHTDDLESRVARHQTERSLDGPNAVARSNWSMRPGSRPVTRHSRPNAGSRAGGAPRRRR
ncbi:MAG: GIY-YIG nuclease family protein [Alphaproteobacteria bacterium]